MKKRLSFLLCIMMIATLCMPIHVTANTTADTVEISYTVPVAGQTPSDIRVYTNTAGFRINEVTWLREDNASMGASEVFQVGANYYIFARISYAARSTPQFLFNGTVGSFQGSGTGGGSTVARVMSPLIAIECIGIGLIDFTYTNPTLGQRPSDVHISSTPIEGISPSISWYHGEASSSPRMATGEVFEVNEVYFFRVEVRFNNNLYRLLVNSPLTINGASARNVFSGINSGTSWIGGYSPLISFKAVQSGGSGSVITTNPGVNNPSLGGLDKPIIERAPTVVNAADVTIPTPQAGQTPQEVVATTSTAGVDIVSVAWHVGSKTGTVLSASQTFSAGQTYYANITLSPQTQANYTFAAGTAFTATVNGTPVQDYSTRNATTAQFMSSGVLLAPAPVDNTPTSSVLQSISAPTGITGIANGAAKTATALKLPNTVVMVTSTGNVNANVTWDTSGSSYDPAKTEAQTVTINGTATLPIDVLNTNNVQLTVHISVTVDALPSAVLDDVTVRYNANGGTGTSPAVVTLASGDSYTIVANPFTREGYSFTGWRTSTTGGTLHAPASTISVIENTMLYAQWELVGVKPEDDTPNNPQTGDEQTGTPIDDTQDNTSVGDTQGNTSGNDTQGNTTQGNSSGTDTQATPGNTTYPSATIVFTIDSTTVMKDGQALAPIDVPAMIINGRTMIPFRYFIETALDGVANFDAETYTITATVRGHSFVMVIDDTTIYVDGKPIELPQAPVIVDSRTLVPLRLIESIAQSVGWDPLTRKATIVL